MSDETMPEATVATGPTDTAAAPAAPAAPPPGLSRTAARPSAKTLGANRPANRRGTAIPSNRRGPANRRSPAIAGADSGEAGPRRCAEAQAPPGIPRGPQPAQARHGSRRRHDDLDADDADADDSDDDDGDEINLGHDYTDAMADRGLTTDDVADVALEEAGLAHTARPRIGDSRPVPKPQIGDSRPAPAGVNGNGNGNAAASQTGEAGTGPKRRRRRGGRGRGRGGAGAGSGADAGATPGGGGGNAPRPQQQSRKKNDDAIRADLGVGETPLAALDDDVLERRRGRTRKGRPAGRYLMCVHVLEGGHTHIAVLEGRSLVEHSLATPTGNESIDGNIYLGRVQNVLPGMEAAFVDIGTPKNGVLYRGDVAFDKADVEGGNKPKIERMLKNGQMIIVQVTKNPIAHKGARLTQEVSLAGRFVVMVPGEPDTYGISKRLPDDERKRLRKVLDVHPARRRRPHRAHRGRGCDRRGARTRRASPPRPVGADLRAGGQVEAGEAPLPGARSRRAAHPRGVHQGVPRHRHRRPRPLRGDPRLRRGDRARARRPGRVLRRRGGGPADLRAVPHLGAAPQGARPQGVAPVGRARSSSSGPRRSP